MTNTTRYSGELGASLPVGQKGQYQLRDGGTARAAEAQRVHLNICDQLRQAGVLAAEAMDKPYASLLAVLDDAYEQAAAGKGKERHANNKPFTQQPMLEIGRMVGVQGPLFQVMKKAQEAATFERLGKHVAAKYELLGAINYLAGAVILLDEAIAKTAVVPATAHYNALPKEDSGV